MSPVKTCQALAMALLLASGTATAGSFVYEGRLDDRGLPANGRYDFQLLPYAAEKGAQPITGALNFWGVEVRDGRFRIDFESPQPLGQEVWLELAVRAGSEKGGFSSIPGRSKAIAAPLIGACWSTVGDSGSDPALNFLGTTDAQPLVLRTANAPSLRIEPSSVTFGTPALPITRNMIGGSHANEVGPGVRGATIGGGGMPAGQSDPNFIVSGANQVLSHYGTVSGGFDNAAGISNSLISGYGATVGGGIVNRAAGLESVVAGGSRNSALGQQSAVGGGSNNTASGARAVVSGGQSNSASGERALVPGGVNNCAGGDQSFAAGTRAKVRPGSSSGEDGAGCEGVSRSPFQFGDEGTFAWADSQTGAFVSTGFNQFLIRSAGGFGLNTAPPTSGIIEMTLQSSSNGNDFSNLWLKQRNVGQDGILITAGGGNGGNNASLIIDHFDGTTQNRRMELANNGSVTIRSNITGANSGVIMAPGGGSFTSLSDRHVKTAIEAVDGLAILERVVELPISTWSYITQDTGIRHIGPMAQDFKAAFEVGESDTGITTVDADGVALAAIQGLNAKLEAENAALQERIERLEAALASLVEQGR